MKASKSIVTRRNGVRVKVTRTAGGSVVEADCSCLGLPLKVHSVLGCPNRRTGVIEPRLS